MRIPDLENVPLLHRAVLTFIIIVIVLLALALIGFLSGGWDDARGQALVLTLPPSKWDSKILELDKEALDEAYRTKMRQLFDVWVREGRENPERPMKGGAEAKRAYIELMKIYEAREQLIRERD